MHTMAVLMIVQRLSQRDWSAFYAPGHEIQAHLEDVVDRYKVRKYIKLRHEVVHARYDEPTGKWHIRIRRPRSGNSDELEEFEDVADMLVTAFGAISRWKMPDFEGMETFKGELHHTAGWNPEEKTWVEAAENWKDKRVGVIGVVSCARIVLLWIFHVQRHAVGVLGYTDGCGTST